MNNERNETVFTEFKIEPELEKHLKQFYKSVNNNKTQKKVKQMLQRNKMEISMHNSLQNQL